MYNHGFLGACAGMLNAASRRETTAPQLRPRRRGVHGLAARLFGLA